MVRTTLTTSRRKKVFVVLAALSALGLVAACSLDLDESLIDRPRDSGVFVTDSTLPDGAPIDGSATDSSTLPSTPEAGACANDDACKTTDGCLKGKCDLARKTCAYEVCRSACSSSACDQGNHTCAAGVPYKYKATSFPLGQQILCGRCAAAIYPWLFVATPTGVVAFNVSNPSAGAPPQVPITNLGFLPNQLVLSGSRVWMTGPLGANASGGRIPVAYIEPPLDPFATKISAKTVLASYNRTEGFTLFARSFGDSALIVGPPASQYASAAIEAPLNEPATITATQIPGFPINSAPFAMSGKRLLLGGLNAGVASFNLVDNAGAQATSGAVTNVTELGNTAGGSRTFAASPDGAIFWATGVNQNVGQPGQSTRAVRGYFLVANDTAPIDDKVGVDIEIYNADPVGVNAGVVGPATMLDANTVMIATAARENTAQTAVQFVKRTPLGTIKEANGTTPRRQVLAIPIDRFAAATSSDGIGYLVSNDIDGPPPSGTVHVFDPGCAP